MGVPPVVRGQTTLPESSTSVPDKASKKGTSIKP